MGMYSKAKILGHPIHPMLVSFPVAFYTAALLTYIAHAVTGDLFWFQVGVVANIAGVVGAALAAIPGLIDWATAIPNRHPAKATGLEHMLLNTGSSIFFGINAFLQYSHWNDPTPTYRAAIALAAVGMGFTLTAGFLGWKMVQKHHVGIDVVGEEERYFEGSGPRTGHPAIRRV
jgi:uncharacterized membrane protein